VGVLKRLKQAGRRDRLGVLAYVLVVVLMSYAHPSPSNAATFRPKAQCLALAKIIDNRYDTKDYDSIPSLRRCDLSNLDLRGFNLSWANLQRSNLSGSKLSGVDFTGADLSDANLKDSRLIGAEFDSSKLLRTDFTRAVLRRASFLDAYMDGTIFRKADLRYSYLDSLGISLGRVDLRGALLTGAYMPDGSIHD